MRHLHEIQASSRAIWRDVVGDVLRTERLDQQRTLADVAEDAGVSLPYLSEIERGRKEVSSDVLDAVIRSLGLDLADVLERGLSQIQPPETDAIGPEMSARSGQRLGPQLRLAA